MSRVTRTSIIILICSGCFTILDAQQDKQNYPLVQFTPAFTLQINLELLKPVPELSASNGGDERSEYIYQGKTFGAGSGFGGSVVSKIRLDKAGMFRFDQSVTYDRIISFPYDDIRSLNDVGEANYNVFTGALGMEYNFVPSKKFRAYLGAELNASLMNGDIKVWFQRLGHPLADSNASYSVSGSFRIGFGLFAGTEYILNSDVGLNAGIRYSDLNAFMKKSEGSNDDSEFQLRDDSNPSLIFAGKKSFSFISFALGVNLYFGTIVKK